MRRFALPVLAALSALTTVLASAQDAAAQQPRRGGGRNEQAEEARRERTRREFEAPRVQLDREANAGPCPFVKVLYDAARYVEFAGASEAAGQVAYTGEIQGVEADCRYRGADPIRVEVDVLFALGRGPQAKEPGKQYRWWVAVTERNRAVLAKEYFALNAEFDPGQDRVAMRERLGEIVIPRASQTVSGNNFEILVGFDVTPAQAAFNRDGKRFRMTAGQTDQTPAR
ncbi:MAG: Tat pathway signal sequence domain protein [Pseudomonadota bacterium]|nr:Tat pathway signal sequence domain protein [Pseudomonadota bacterium]